MKIHIIKYFIILSYFFFGCQYSDSDYNRTREVCNSLYLETYTVAGGVYASNTNGYILNDSNGFNQELFVITKDELTYFDFCLENSILFIILNPETKTIKKAVLLNLKDNDYKLKQLHNNRLKVFVENSNSTNTFRKRQIIYNDSSIVIEKIRLNSSKNRFTVFKDELKQYFDIDRSLEVHVESTPYFHAVIIMENGLARYISLF